VAFAAPDGVKKLRELILSLAMQGKLVPQDPSDQPASELLKEIKYVNYLSEIEVNEQPNLLPKSWKCVRIGDVFELKSGYSFPKDAELQSGTYMYLKVGEMNAKGNEIAITSTSIFLDESPRVLNALIPANSIIFPKRGGAIATNKKRLVIEPICVDTNIMAIICPRNIDLNFVYHWILSLDLAKLNTGTSVPQINNKDINPLLFPLPPIAEQRRIVAKIDELMARCDELEKLRQVHAQKQITVHNAALNQLLTAKDHNDFKTSWHFITQHFGELYSVKANVTELRKAILQLAVMGKLVPQDPNDQPASELLNAIEAEKNRLVKEGKMKAQTPLPEIRERPYILPTSWEWVRFEDIVEISSGVTKGRKLNDKEMVVLPYLRVANVQRGYLDLDVIKYIEIPRDEIARFELKERDLLITEGGDWDKVGRTAIWNAEILHCIHQNHIFKARRLLAEQNEQWLEKYLNSSAARGYFANASKQTTNLASINKTQLRGCPIPLPPLAEQHRIVAKIDQLMTLCDELEKQIDIANSKKTNLLNSVMTKV
jgi:type I restriction enzyme S subunit